MSLYDPSPSWHPAARDAYDERIAILTQGPQEPTVSEKRIAWMQAEAEDRVHKQAAKPRQWELL